MYSLVLKVLDTKKGTHCGVRDDAQVPVDARHEAVCERRVHLGADFWRRFGGGLSTDLCYASIVN